MLAAALRRYCQLTTAALAVLHTLPSFSQTVVPFETEADFTAYTTRLTSNAVLNRTPVSPEVETNFGTGTPASGGLRFQGNSGATDRGSISFRALTADPATVSTYTTSLLIQPWEANNSAKDKIELRMGFTSGSDTLDAAKPWEFFHKHNPGISLRFQLDHDTAASKTNLLNVEMTSVTVANGSETKSGALTLNPGTAYDNQWLKLSFTLTRTGSSTFTASYTLDAVGTDGTSAPTNIFTSTAANYTHAPLASAATVYTGFALKTEKSKTTRAFVDDHSYTTTSSAPPTPTALAATSVNSTGLTANWSPGSGLPATSYLLEVTTQANNFVPGTFLSATGVSGQSTGITVSGAALSQIITGLSPLQSYVYRVSAVNAVGTSAASGVITTTTPNTNAPPYADALSDVGPIASYAPPITVSLSGISAGGEGGQSVSITATSSNTAVIPHPTTSYTAPASAGSLTFDPTGTEGTATITVTLNDGQAENATFQRSFTVMVSNPPVNVSYASAADLSFYNITANNITNSFSSNAGVNGAGGIISQISSLGSDSASLFLRSQTYPQPGVTQFTASVMVNMREWDDQATGERKGDIRLGFSAGNTISSSKPDEFFNKTNHGLGVVLKGEHSVADLSKNRKLECELFMGSTDAKANKITLTNLSTAFNNWLKLSFILTPIGSDQYLTSYQLEDCGPNGTDTPSVLMSSASATFTNASFSAANWLYAGYSVKPDKANAAALYHDEHSISVSIDPPATPVATAATRVTSSSFNANWVPGSGAYATGWIVEAVAGAATAFSAGNYLSATGATGQSTGISLSGNALRTLRISGLLPSTIYRYRVRAANLNGTSAASAILSLTTLATGVNAVPTLDAISNPTPVAVNSGEQVISLAGISDGGEQSQTVTITATSSNTTLIPHPTVTYFSPNEAGFLSYTPNPDTVGSSTITVTVQDGGANNASFSRTFTVQVVAPAPLIPFSSASDLSLIGFTNNAATTVTHQPTAGVSSAGAIRMETGTAGTERVAVGIRPTAYDAASAGYLVSSMMVNFSQVLNATTKDKGELRLGFTTNSTANSSNLKDTMNKTAGNASLGVVFKAEHSVLANEADKFQKIEAELFMGPADTKAGKQTLLNQGTALAHWLKVNLYAVRSGLSSFYLTYIIEDWGSTGASYQGVVLSSGPHIFSSAAFGSDTSVFSTFVWSADAAGAATSTFLMDESFAEVNTTAPHSPVALQEMDLQHTSFTANWTPAASGPLPDGFILELCRASDNFSPGSFISATGALNQSSGIVISDPYALDITITGLVRQTTYLYRVRSYSGVLQSAVLNAVDATTTYGPGLEYVGWRPSVFGGNAGNESIAGPNADPDHDGVPNLLEWAFNMNPQSSDVQLLPQPTISGPYLRMVYQRRHNVSGYTFTPEISSNLSSWVNDEVIYVSISAPDANGMETVVVEDEFPTAANPRRFMRVRVE